MIPSIEFSSVSGKPHTVYGWYDVTGKTIFWNVRDLGTVKPTIPHVKRARRIERLAKFLARGVA